MRPWACQRCAHTHTACPGFPRKRQTFQRLSPIPPEIYGTNPSAPASPLHLRLLKSEVFKVVFLQAPGLISCKRAAVLRLENHAQQGLLTKLAGPIPRVPDSEAWEEAGECAFLTSFGVTLMLRGQGTHFEDHGGGALLISKCFHQHGLSLIPNVEHVIRSSKTRSVAL